MSSCTRSETRTVAICRYRDDRPPWQCVSVSAQDSYAWRCAIFSNGVDTWVRASENAAQSRTEAHPRTRVSEAVEMLRMPPMLSARLGRLRDVGWHKKDQTGDGLAFCLFQ